MRYFPVGARVLTDDIAYVVIDVEDEEEAPALQPAVRRPAQRLGAIRWFQSSTLNFGIRRKAWS